MNNIVSNATCNASPTTFAHLVTIDSGSNNNRLDLRWMGTITTLITDNATNTVYTGAQLFMAAGQIAAGTGVGSGKMLAKGSASQVLTVGGSDASGLEWVHPPTPFDYTDTISPSLQVMNYDPVLVTNYVQPVSGSIYAYKLFVRQSTTISNICMFLNLAGGAQNNTYVGLYSSAGALLSSSSDVSSNWTGSSGLVITNALTTPQAVAAGAVVYAAFIVNGAGVGSIYKSGSTNQPGFNAGFVSPGLNSPTGRFQFSNGGSLTSMPADLTTAGINWTAAPAFWIALS
jgi:hypothetical protein